MRGGIIIFFCLLIVHSGAQTSDSSSIGTSDTVGTSQNSDSQTSPSTSQQTTVSQTNSQTSTLNTQSGTSRSAYVPPTRAPPSNCSNYHSDCFGCAQANCYFCPTTSKCEFSMNTYCQESFLITSNDCHCSRGASCDSCIGSRSYSCYWCPDSNTCSNGYPIGCRGRIYDNSGIADKCPASASNSNLGLSLGLPLAFCFVFWCFFACFLRSRKFHRRHGRYPRGMGFWLLYGLTRRTERVSSPPPTVTVQPVVVQPVVQQPYVQPYPQQGYPPPQQGGYAPPQQGGYAPPQYPQGGYPPQQYPPQQQGYPQQGYAPPPGAYNSPTAPPPY